MKIYIDELTTMQDGKLHIHFDEVIVELGNNKPVTGDLTAISTAYGVAVKGNIQTELVLECDRCLSEYTHQITFELDENFVKGQELDCTKSEIELKSDNFVEELGDSKEIDLTDFIYQSIILNMPNKKLCDITCLGSEEYIELKNQNLIDPRLQIFKNMTDEIKKQKGKV